MVVGEVVECGSKVTEYELGDIVCSYGPIMETVIVKAVDNYKLRKLPKGANWKNAVCYDPAQFAMSGVRDAHVRAGDYVVVVGLGAIGQIAIQLAKKAGASVVIGVDPLSHRREIAEKHGADATFDPITTDVGLEVKRLTGKLGADSIIETSGNAAALQAALRGIAYGGTISYVASRNLSQKDLILVGKLISTMRKLSFHVRLVNQIRIIRAGIVSVSRRLVGNY